MSVLRGIVGTVARALRDAVDRLRHRTRRAEAIARVRSVPPGAKVLFVCLGNICRSPYAAALLRARRPDLTVESAGFIGPGRPPAEKALLVASERGVEHESHRSRLIRSDDLEGADVLIAFDPGHLRRLRRLDPFHARRAILMADLDPEWHGSRAILDPYGTDIETFRETFDRIEACVEALSATIPGPGATEPTPSERGGGR